MATVHPIVSRLRYKLEQEELSISKNRHASMWRTSGGKSIFHSFEFDAWYRLLTWWKARSQSSESGTRAAKETVFCETWSMKWSNLERMREISQRISKARSVTVFIYLFIGVIGKQKGTHSVSDDVRTDDHGGWTLVEENEEERVLSDW